MSYENPVTYVDTESAKIMANTISGLGQMGAKLISDETKKRAKKAEENKLKNEKKQQAYKKYQLAGQSNVNLLTKDLDFGSNESFRNATSGIVDQLAKAKSDYEFATDPDDIKRLSQEINQLDTFLTKTFGGEMDDLMADIEDMRNIMTKSGAEGGLDLEQNADYTAFLMAMAQGNQPGEMSFVMDPKTQDIILTVKGEDYTNGEYTISLRGNQSTDISKIPNVEKSMRLGENGKPSALQNIGIFDEGGTIPPKYFSSEVGDSQNLANNVTIFRYKINEQGEKLVKDAVIAEAAGLLNGGEGLAGGIKSTNSYYRNILLRGKEYQAAKNGDSEDIPAFLEPGSHDVTDSEGNILYTVPVNEKSWNALVDRMTDREISFVNSKMAPQKRNTVSAPTGGKGTEGERKERADLDNFARTESISIASGSGITELYDQVKSNTSTYDYDPGTGFTSDVRSEKDYKEGIASLTPQQLNDQGFIKFTDSELKNPETNGKLKSTIQDKIDNYLSTLGDSEDKFVNFNDGSAMNEKDALVALFNSTPKYKDLKPSQIEKLVVEALKKRPEKESNEFEEDISMFQTDNIDDVESGEFSEEYKSATEEIGPAKRPAFSQTDAELFGIKIGNKDKYKERKKERSKLVAKQKKDRKFLEQKYPNVTWPWEK